MTEYERRRMKYEKFLDRRVRDKRKVLELMKKGYTTPQIAKELGRDEHYVATLRRDMPLKTILAAVDYAERNCV